MRWGRYILVCAEVLWSIVKGNLRTRVVYILITKMEARTKLITRCTITLIDLNMANWWAVKLILSILFDRFPVVKLLIDTFFTIRSIVVIVR